MSAKCTEVRFYNHTGPSGKEYILQVNFYADGKIEIMDGAHNTWIEHWPDMSEWITTWFPDIAADIAADNPFATH